MTNYIKKDIEIYKNTKDKLYKKKLELAYEICETLKIQDKITFYLYQIQLDILKEVDYEEITSFKRLKNKNYYNTIRILINSIDNNSKIIKFPKAN